MKTDMDIIYSIMEDVAFYVDRYDHHIVYAEYAKPSGAQWFTLIEHDDFQSFVRMRYMEETGGDEEPDVKAVLRHIHDVANYNEDFDEVETYVRVAGNLHGKIEYSLSNRLQQVVRVSNGAWKLSRFKSFKFLSSSGSAQVAPVKSKSDIKTLIQRYVNLTGDSFLLFLVWLIQGFSCGNHYGLMISAGPGSGKSSLTRLISRLLDPSESEAGFIPKRVEDLQTDLANRYLACYDNNSGISKEFSDMFCTAITGGTVTKRKLYTNNETVCLRLHNTVVINGISIFPEEADLAERFLYLQLKKLPQTALISEHDLWANFDKDKPLILGCIFDVLAKATLCIKNLKLTNKPRMADAFVEMVAIAEALGIEQKEFLRIVTENTTALQKACAEKDIVAAVREYMNGPAMGRQKISGMSNELYTKISDNYSGGRNALPNSASHFSRRLNTERAALAAAGFEIDIDPTGQKGSIMTIRRIKR